MRHSLCACQLVGVGVGIEDDDAAEVSIGVGAVVVGICDVAMGTDDVVGIDVDVGDAAAAG